MKNDPKSPCPEEQGLPALQEYGIPGAGPDPAFDDIARLAALFCQTPVALVCFFDAGRTWLGSVHGLHMQELPAATVLPASGLLQAEKAWIVQDTRQNRDFGNRSLLPADPELTFFAGLPLRNARGCLLGSLAVMDRHPRKLSETQMDMLGILARQLVQRLEERRSLLALKTELEQKSMELERFAYVISHDIKSPLSSIVLTAEMLRDSLGDRPDEDNEQLLNVLNRSAFKIRNLAEAVLSYYRGERAMQEPAETVVLGELLRSVAGLLRLDEAAEVHYPDHAGTLQVNKAALEQILQNLLQNAVRYSDKERTVISIRFRETGSHYYFEVEDNGRGIAEADQQKIFGLFTTLGIPDRQGITGTGIGLAIVKKLVEKQGGQISLHSIPGEKSLFSFSLKKS
jgi:signal transduction histidine kinase